MVSSVAKIGLGALQMKPLKPKQVNIVNNVPQPYTTTEDLKRGEEFGAKFTEAMVYK